MPLNIWNVHGRMVFTPLTVGCPIIIADGLKGTDDIDVPVEGGEYVKANKIGRSDGCGCLYQPDTFQGT